MKSRVSLLAATCLVVAACSGGGGETTTTNQAEESVTVETTTGGGESSTTTGSDTTTTAGGSGSTGEECVIGTWVLDDESFFDEVFADMIADETSGITEVTATDGEFQTTFGADGTMEAVRTNWGFSAVTAEGTFNVSINGEQTGSWEIEGNMLLLTLDDGAGFDIEATVVVDGEEVPLPSAPFDLPAEALSSSSDFECEGNTLTVVNEGVTSNFHRA